MNLAILKAEARTVAKRREDRLQAAIDENRDLTEEEEAADTEDAKALARLTSQIQRAEQLIQASSAIGADLPAPPPPAAASVPAAARAGRDTGGFRDISEFATAVRLANPAAGQHFRIDDRLAAPSSTIGESGDAAGSYLVPPAFREEIVEVVFEGEDAVIAAVDPSPTASNRVVGLGDETTPWGTSGVQAYWRSEGQQMSASRTELQPRETVLNECYAFVNATEELLEDGPRIADLLTRKAGAAIRWKTAEAFMWGDGIGKPLGWMSSNALVTVAKEGGQAADTVVRQNVAKMFARVINPTQAIWLVNPDVLPQIMELANGAGFSLWFPNYQLAPGGTLLGRPVHFTEHCDTVGDLGDIQLVNPNGYEAFRKQNGVSFAESIHLYFDYNVRAFRWVFRIGGQPVLSAAVTPDKSAATRSHFIALAERA